MKKLICLPILTGFLLVAISSTTFAQDTEKEKNPIDIRLDNCLNADSNYANINLVKCEIKALEEWDAELNKTYKEFKDALDPSLQENLRDAQRKWVTYKESETQFMDAMYEKMEGTMWQIVIVDRQKEVIRQRAIELKNYYDTWQYK